MIGSRDGAAVDLRPLRYEFPEALARGPEDLDANWLVVRGDVRAADGRSWSFTDPCLTTTEARAVGAWLRAVAAGEAVPDLAFVEPALAFGDRGADASGGGVRGKDEVKVAVRFSLQAAPPWVDREGRRGAFGIAGVPVVLRLTGRELRAAAEEWQRDLAVFPVR